MTFGEKVKQLRRKAKLSQRQLAEAAGLEVITIRHYEQGRNPVPSWPAVMGLSKALGVTCDVFRGCSYEKRAK